MNQTIQTNPLNRFIDRLSKSISKWSTRRFLLCIIVVQIILHIPIAPLPPMGQHTWRQVMGAATARNYFEENDSFLYPSQDVRVSTNDKGIIYFEFPLLYYIMGKSYYLTGFSHVNTRLIMLLSGILLIIGSYKLMRSLNANEARARWFVFFISCSPYFFYYSITVSPNLPALTWFIWGLAMIIPQIESSKWDWRFWLGIIMITFGTLSKATYLFFGIPIAYLFLNHLKEEPKVKSFLITGLSFLIVTIPNIFNYLHSKNLFENAPYERQRFTELQPDFFPESLLDVASTLRPAIVEWFLQLYVNTIAIPFFLVGLFAAIKYKKWKTKSGKFWITWLASFFIFGSLFFTQFRQHAYYMTPLLMIAAMGSTYGIEILWRSKKMRFILCLMLLFIPIVMVGRVGHRWLWAKQVPDELVYNSDQLKNSIPKNELVMVFGDSSPVVYLYYLHRKGVSLSPSISREDLSNYLNQGFRYIVSDVDIHGIPALQGMKIKKIKTVGNFSIYMI